MNIQEFIQAACVLKETGLTIRPIFYAHEPLSKEDMQSLRELEAGVQTDCAQVIADCFDLGLQDLYFECKGHNAELLSSLHGKCRYILGSKTDVKALDRAVAPFLQYGYMETVAIQLQNIHDAERFTPDNIPEFSRWLRFSDNLAVRGIFMDIQGNQSENAKQSFSLLKKIRSDMPCLFSYFCFDGLLQPLADGDAEVLQTLKMLASLNDTSLYAGFYIK